MAYAVGMAIQDCDDAACFLKIGASPKSTVDDHSCLGNHQFWRYTSYALRKQVRGWHTCAPSCHCFAIRKTDQNWSQSFGFFPVRGFRFVDANRAHGIFLYSVCFNGIISNIWLTHGLMPFFVNKKAYTRASVLGTAGSHMTELR